MQKALVVLLAAHPAQDLPVGILHLEAQAVAGVILLVSELVGLLFGAVLLAEEEVV
jgi:hypothetical protein